MRLGLDLDNTLIDYDRAFVAAARRAGLAEFQGNVSKRAVRDYVRAFAEGEQLWTALQAEVYGPSIMDARPAEGVAAFLIQAKALKVHLSIISHKTQFAAASPDGADLRQAALAWLEASRLLTLGGIDASEIFFTDTRAEKVARIRSLRLDAFVDDLASVLAHEEFPPSVRRIHYNPSEEAVVTEAALETCRDWAEVADRLFGKPRDPNNV